MPYSTPPGYIDQPYWWCFDADSLTDGSDAQNAGISLPGGYDFIVRRISGLNSVLNNSTGSWNLRANNKKNVNNAPMRNPLQWADRLIFPELVYPQTGIIGFDLFGIQRAVKDGTYYSQIAFHGVRRTIGREATYGRAFRRVPYTLVLPIALNWESNSTRLTRSFSFSINNFDFEAHCIYWTVGATHAPLSTITGVAGGIAKFVLKDYAQNGLMPVPMRIEYLNEPIPFGQSPTTSQAYRFKSGAIQPVLLYPKDSTLTVDIESLLPAASGLSYVLNLNIIGMQRIPC